MSALVEKIAALIAPNVAIERGEGQNAISRDAAILDQLLAAGSETSFIRLWTNRQCLVTTRTIARIPTFAKAAAEAQGSGWPVHVRHSGGSTVVHRPGILNISLFHAGNGRPSGIDAAYAGLVSRIEGALAALGVASSVGPVPGSYCDGRYNILVDGRKISGTACHFRTRGPRHAQLAHASLTVGGDIEADIEAISRFERALGIESQYQQGAHAVLADYLLSTTAHR